MPICSWQPTPPIKEFQGEYRFLSNFYPAQMHHDGLLFPTSEHAFQAAKTLNFQYRWEISQLSTPGQAKRAGKEVLLRPDWEQAKVRIMAEIVALKFLQNPPLLRKLLQTGVAVLEEGNQWHDTFWGICDGKGNNHLGKILMSFRDRVLGG